MALADITQKAKDINWQKMQGLLSPASMSKLDAFLDKLLSRGGTALYAAGAAWGVAAIMILLTFSYTTQIKTLKEDLAKTVANTPLVPTINMVPIPSTDLLKYSQKLNKTYSRIDAREVGEGSITIRSANVQNFNQWRNFIRDLQYGGPNWRVTIQKMCTGRSCLNGEPLMANLKVERMEIIQPAPPPT